jgi:GH24 family phage-related lysozyme (muramidase)
MNVHVYDRLWNWLYATEGPVPYMYLDGLGLVTVGIGFMIDPIADYINQWGRSFVKNDGTAAGPEEVKTEFNRVKLMQDKKGAHLNFKAGAQLTLPASAMKPTLLNILRQKEAALKTGWRNDFFSDFENFPPDAQMGVLSTAYGSLGNKSLAEVAFNNACKNQDWAAAANSGRWDGWRPEKIIGHKLMFNNAQAAKDTRDDNPQPAFPGTLTASGYEIDDAIKPFRQNIWKAGG